THGPSQRVIDSRLVGYVGESPVAIVVEEAVGVTFVVERARESVGAEILPLGIGIKLQVVPHEEIQFAVAVVIEPGCAGSKVGILDPGFRRYVSKRSISVVVVEDGGIPVADVDVFVSV